MPDSKKKNRTTVVAENCGIPEKVDLVKDYYNMNANVNEIILKNKLSLLHHGHIFS